ncbi:hypothetical protein MRQ36_29140 [Micromonospora sp. R77]|uniref:hypothetical protein n=1 Tax=Micromonospora sp. R77 TaxID=2925836 RepID=UPI001F624B24|nr:hypothetical protein [Micromonospora sp. R77]MCI4066401.1 hypothetical protein [Micromonospora sp. R77]
MIVVRSPHPRCTVVAALLVLASGFLPWFRSGWAAWTDGVDSYQTNTASAWAASTWWSMGLGVNVVAAVVSLLLARRQGRPIRFLRWALAAASLAGLVVTVGAWLDIPERGLLLGGAWTTTDTHGQVGDINRDRLEILHLDGLDYDVGWGLYVGIAAMSILCGLLILDALGSARLPDVTGRGQ